MPTVITDLLSSKKFIMAVIACAAAIAGRYGFDLDQTTTLEVVSILVGAILAQGVADHGKAAAIVAASTRTTTSVASATAPTVVAVESKSVAP